MKISELLESIPLDERIASIESALLNYKDRDDIYISYSDLPKLGINPKTNYDTPAGIYCYPLKPMYPSVHGNTIPFAGDRRYVLVLQYNTGRVLEIGNYNEAEYQKDLQTLRTNIPNMFKISSEVFDDIVDDGENNARQKTPSGKLWNVTRLLALDWRGNGGPKSTAGWNKILRSLGFVGAEDQYGTGLIHPAEPTQAVWFTASAIKLIEVLPNIRKGVDRSGEIDREPSKIVDMPHATAQEQYRAISNSGKALKTLVNKRLLKRSVVVMYLRHNIPYRYKELVDAGYRFGDRINIYLLTHSPDLRSLLKAMLTYNQVSDAALIAAIQADHNIASNIVDILRYSNHPLSLPVITAALSTRDIEETKKVLISLGLGKIPVPPRLENTVRQKVGDDFWSAVSTIYNIKPADNTK